MNEGKKNDCVDGKVRMEQLPWPGAGEDYWRNKML